MVNELKDKEYSKNKFGFKELLWMGFTFTCSGVTFTTAFAVSISGQNSGIGYWIFLVIVLGALLAGGTSIAYKRCSSLFKNSNGSGYIYVRSVFGRFLGWLIGFFQYITLPTSIIVAILALIDQNIGNLIPSSINVLGKGQKYQHLVLNIIGVAIFFIFSFAIYFGIKGLRVTISIITTIQWLSTIIIIICAVVLFAKQGQENLVPFTKNKNITFGNINNSLITFIYFYVGFETYSTIGKNLKNPKKHLGKAIMLILLIVTLFYIIVTFIFIGAIGINNFANNSTQAGINHGNNPSVAVIKNSLGVVGTIIIVSSIIASKLNSCVQSSLYGSTMIEPLAIEGYISNKLAKMKKDNISFSSSFLNTLVTLFLALFILIIPNLFNSDIDFSSAVNFSSFFTLITYFSVILAVFWLWYKQKIKLKIWELIIMAISLISLIWISFFYLFQLFYNIFKDNDFIINLIQLISIILLFAFAIIWYFTYYRIIYNNRMKKNKEIQVKLDQAFLILK